MRERFRMHGYNRIQQEEAYRFYQTSDWKRSRFPGFLSLRFSTPRRFIIDSDMVNSANVGPVWRRDQLRADS